MMSYPRGHATPRSSSGLGRRVLIPVTGVRLPYGVLFIDIDRCIAPSASRGVISSWSGVGPMKRQTERLVSEASGHQPAPVRWGSAGTRNRQFNSLGRRSDRPTVDRWQPTDRQSELLAVKVNRDAINAPPDYRLPAIQLAIDER